MPTGDRLTKQRKYSDQEKAAALSALLAGQSLNAVAKEYDIPKGTLSYWRSASNPSNKIEPKKADAIGDLLLQYLETNLTALRAQAEQFSDMDWLQKQGASEAAVLHGVMTDKAIRLLEAMERAGVAGDTTATN